MHPHNMHGVPVTSLRLLLVSSVPRLYGYSHLSAYRILAFQETQGRGNVRILTSVRKVETVPSSGWHIHLHNIQSQGTCARLPLLPRILTEPLGERGVKGLFLMPHSMHAFILFYCFIVPNNCQTILGLRPCCTDEGNAAEVGIYPPGLN